MLKISKRLNISVDFPTVLANTITKQKFPQFSNTEHAFQTLHRKYSRMHPFTVTFDIEFPYKGSNLSAVVHRYNTQPVQYLVMMEKKNNLNISLPLVLTANVASGLLENPEFDRNVIDPISAAISRHCIASGLPFVS